MTAQRHQFSMYISLQTYFCTSQSLHSTLSSLSRQFFLQCRNATWCRQCETHSNWAAVTTHSKNSRSLTEGGSPKRWRASVTTDNDIKWKGLQNSTIHQKISITIMKPLWLRLIARGLIIAIKLLRIHIEHTHWKIYRQQHLWLVFSPANTFISVSPHTHTHKQAFIWLFVLRRLIGTQF